MDGNKTAKIIGAAAATLAAGPALAQSGALHEAPVPQASSYAELLQPIPNAVERLKIADAEAEAQARLIPVQYGYGYDNGYQNGYRNGYQYQNDHHHDHHHHHNRRWYQTHGYVWFLGRWVTRDYYNSHHHHHHDHHHHNS
jgi:hypothetical protein